MVNDSVTSLTRYYLDGATIIAEDRNGKLIQYYYDSTGVIGMNYNGTDFYYEKDMFGNIIKIKDVIGHVVAEYAYDAWGNCKITSEPVTYPISAINIAKNNPFRYRGYYMDTETGYYYLQTRYYDPDIRRFISSDSYDLIPMLAQAGDLNMYAYCSNNPVMYVDPSGHFSVSAFLFGLAITWVISSIASYYLGEHLVSGASSIYGGVQTISTGISLLAYGPVGWVLGGAAIALGTVNIAFGTAEIQQHFTGNNWINDIGITGDLYTGLYIASSIASAAVSIGGNYYKTTTHGQRAFALQNVKNFGYTDTVKQHMMDSGYFGKKYGNTGITTKGATEIRPYTNSLWAQKTIIKYGVMSADEFGWVFTYDGYRLGIKNASRLIWHFGQGF